MSNDAKRELRTIFDRIASSRALMDVPAIVAEGRDLAATVKGSEAGEISRYLDAIAAAETSTQASMVAGSALSYLDRLGALGAAAIAEPGTEAAANAALPATERARAARTSAPSDKPPKSAAARKRAPSKRAGGK